MWKTVVELDGSQITIWRTRFPRLHTHTHSEYIVRIAFPQQQWLRERASLLRYTYIACLVNVNRVVESVFITETVFTARYGLNLDYSLLLLAFEKLNMM